MACLLKAPDGALKGCVTFTTQERDLVINKSADLRAAIQALKRRYVIGLHHNWHDHHFRYDPLFDFSMAGEGDLIEAEGKDFARIPLDACNFAPPCYSAPRAGEPFWDILYVARAVNFKGIPQFLAAIRDLYDQGWTPRVLFICPVPETLEIPGIADLRAHFEATFDPVERQRVVLLTIDWDYPFPLDSDSLAFFYRNSRIFFHAAPQERRCRVAAYAWAGGMPVVCSEPVSSILPAHLRKPPFLYVVKDGMPAWPSLALALDSRPEAANWHEVIDEFSTAGSADRIDIMLHDLAMRYRWGTVAGSPVAKSKLDLRLGRHHGISLGANRIDMSLAEFVHILDGTPDRKLDRAAESTDPELFLVSTKSENNGFLNRLMKKLL
jgi:hypothetical protein